MGSTKRDLVTAARLYSVGEFDPTVDDFPTVPEEFYELAEFGYVAGMFWTVTAAGTFSGSTEFPLVTPLDVEVDDYVIVAEGGYPGVWEVVTADETLTTKMLEKPSGTSGHPIGWSDWRISVEMLVPENLGARWGVATWDVDEWSFYEWADLTEWVRGIRWERGSSEYAGRIETGTAQITLDNIGDRFSPVNTTTAWRDLNVALDGRLYSSGFGPGSVVRIVAHSPTGTGTDSWVPQLTGRVATWDEGTSGVGADRRIEVELVETIGELARVNENELASVVGNDDTPTQRIERLADAAGWRFGYCHEFEYIDPSDGEPGGQTAYALASTSMSQNRLGEVHLTADSVGAVARSGRDGRLAFYNRPPRGCPIRGPIGLLAATALWGSATWGESEWPEEGFRGLEPYPTGTVGGVYSIPWTADSLEIDNDDRAIVNRAEFGRVGSTSQISSDSSSEHKFGRVTRTRNDLVNKSDALCQWLADELVADRGQLTYRVAGVELHSGHPETLPAIISLDIHSAIRIAVTAQPRTVVESASVDWLEHSIVPLSEGRVEWRARLMFGHQTAIRTST